MTLIISKKEYKLHFGLDFVAYLDKKYFITESGFQLGQGLTYVVAQIELGNPLILLDLIAAGTIAGAKPNVEDVKKYIETEANIEKLMAEFVAALEASPTTSFTMKKLALLSAGASEK